LSSDKGSSFKLLNLLSFKGSKFESFDGSKLSLSFSFGSVNFYNASIEIVNRYEDDTSVLLRFCLLFMICGRIDWFWLLLRFIF
jgi:hypothetical protein